MDRRRGRGLALLLAAMLLCLMLPAGTLAQGGVVEGSTVSGTVRVYLSSIGTCTQVDVTVDGSYSIGGDTSKAIARGAQLSVRNSGGTLMLTQNGQTQTMGSRFELRRHQTSGNNGVRIAQARYPQNLYPGDIEFIAKGGYAQIVVNLLVEQQARRAGHIRQRKVSGSGYLLVADAEDTGRVRIPVIRVEIYIAEIVHV